MSDFLPWLTFTSDSTTRRNSPGRTHHLIPVGGSRSVPDLLDWTEETGHYDVWVSTRPRVQAAATDFDLWSPTPRLSGVFPSIRLGHDLIYLSDTPGSLRFGNVLDLDLNTREVRVFRLDRDITVGDPMPQSLNRSRFATIESGHELVYLDGDRVLDWEFTSGRARVWAYDRQRTTTDPLPTKLNEVMWPGLIGSNFVYLGGDLLLDWDETDGEAVVWAYDRSLLGEGVDPFPVSILMDDWTVKIPRGHKVHYVGSDMLLDWNPDTGRHRLWTFDRPMMADAPFGLMLTQDLGTATSWAGAALAALAAYQAGLITGVHDGLWNVTNALLARHFRAHTHPSGLLAAVAMIQEVYSRMLQLFSTGGSTYVQVSKQRAVQDLGNETRYERAYSGPGQQVKLTPSYRPLDTMGHYSLDGAGNKLRAAILIRMTAQSNGLDVDHAEEHRAEYDTIPPAQTVRNPATYAVFAHHVATGQELRFQLQAWL